MRYYPLFANLSGKVCLAVGEGALIAEKADSLASCGAEVRRRKQFDPSEAEDAFLIVADVHEELAQEIAAYGEASRILVNIVDKPKYCSFIIPAIVRQGDLLIAVSTSGQSPALAGWVRERLQMEFGAEYGDLVEALGATREQVKERLESYADRKAFYRRLLEGGILETARTRGRGAVTQELHRVLQEFIQEASS